MNVIGNWDFINAVKLLFSCCFKQYKTGINYGLGNSLKPCDAVPQPASREPQSMHPEENGAVADRFQSKPPECTAAAKLFTK